MALISLARSQLLPMAATFFVAVAVVLIASSGLAEGQSIHVSLRITKPDPAVVAPSSVPVDHEFGQYPDYRSSRIERTHVGESRWDDEYPRWAVSPRVHVINLRLTVKLLLQIASDPSAADAWVQRNVIRRSHRCSQHQPHHHQYHKISMPSTTTTTAQRIPFGGTEEIFDHQNDVIRSAMQNIFDSLGASPAGLQDEVRVVRPSGAEDDHIHRGDSINYILDPPVEGCSCRGHNYAHITPSTRDVPHPSTVSPQEISIPIIDHTAPVDASIRDRHQVRYRNHFDAYDDQNSGSSSIWFGNGRAGGEGPITYPTTIKDQEKAGYKGILEYESLRSKRKPNVELPRKKNRIEYKTSFA